MKIKMINGVIDIFKKSVYKSALQVTAIMYILGIIEFVCFTVFKSFHTDILIGVLYGTTFAALNFFYLAYCVDKSVTKGENGAKAYMSATYSVRIFLTGLMIFIAAAVNIINIWAAIIPLVFQRIAIFIISLFKRGDEN